MEGKGRIKRGGGGTKGEEKMVSKRKWQHRFMSLRKNCDA